MWADLHYVTSCLEITQNGIVGIYILPADTSTSEGVFMSRAHERQPESSEWRGSVLLAKQFKFNRGFAL